ncbi:hypothetical protein AQUCO_01800023v1 [Aquilegia coerulea]|uniref:LOB domain-containing protein n=1 Tax=Aquilegia coerulea TaxID=218851 RepID=A0A2G5DJJ5_AQUCA|nr:hypothetical protein AQUCO_01800023v1 [Aquilegia coerulea]
MANPTRCAGCRYLRRRCPEDCVLAPYFLSSNPERFICVHRIFGASNVSRMLMQLPVVHRAAAADCMSYEAANRVRDPVYGCTGIIYQLQQQIAMLERELAKAQGEIAFYNAQQQEMNRDQDQGESSLFNASQQQPFHLDQQLLLHYYQLNLNP